MTQFDDRRQREEARHQKELEKIKGQEIKQEAKVEAKSAKDLIVKGGAREEFLDKSRQRKELEKGMKGEATFARDKLGITNQPMPEADKQYLDKVLSNPNAIRSFLINPDATIKVLEKHGNLSKDAIKALEDAAPYGYVNGKIEVNKDSTLYKHLAADVEAGKGFSKGSTLFKRNGRSELDRDLDKLNRGDGRERDVEKLMLAQIRLDKGLDPGAEKKMVGLRQEIINDRNHSGAQKDLKALEVLARDTKVAGKVVNNVNVDAKPTAAPTTPTPEPSVVATPEVKVDPLVAHKQRIDMNKEAVAKATTVAELMKASASLTNGLSAEEAKVLNDAMKGVKMDAGRGSEVSYERYVQNRREDLATDAIREFDEKLKQGRSPAEIRELAKELHRKFPEADVSGLDAEIKKHLNGTPQELVQSRVDQMLSEKVASFSEVMEKAKSPAEIRLAKSELSKGLDSAEKESLLSGVELKYGQNLDAVTNSKIDNMLTNRANLARDAIYGLGFNRDQFIAAYSDLEKIDVERLDTIFRQRNGQSVLADLGGEHTIGSEDRKVFEAWAKGDMETGNKLFAEIKKKQSAQAILGTVTPIRTGY